MPGRGALVGPFPDGVDHEEYDKLRRRVLWKLPSGLYLLGSAAGDEKNLMTLSLAVQVATVPKQLAVSVEKAALSHRLVSQGRCYSLSLLAREDRALVRRFVKPAAHDPVGATLNGVGYRVATTGAPIPESAVAWLDCELREEVDLGSHSVFVGEVMEAGVAPGSHPEDIEVLRMEDTLMSYGG